MAKFLLADIGGSTTRFALAGADGRPDCIITIDNDTVSSLETAIRIYLDEVDDRPNVAILAVAGPVDGEEIALTNRGWRFHLDQLRVQFGFNDIRAINDFEALAWALPSLGAEDLRTLGPARKTRAGTKVVLGPGTGLGVAASVPNGNGWQAIASEGGHVSFGPASPDEVPIFERLMNESGMVSAEMAISGPGLERLHRAANPHGMPLEAKAIVAEAQAGNAAARAVVDLFVRLLGRFAGDVALTFKATGGVYIAGGIALKLGSLFDETIFRAAFEAHPPYRLLLQAIPTSLLLCVEPGLIGCAAAAVQLVRQNAPREGPRPFKAGRGR